MDYERRMENGWGELSKSHQINTCVDQNYISIQGSDFRAERKVQSHCERGRGFLLLRLDQIQQNFVRPAFLYGVLKK